MTTRLYRIFLLLTVLATSVKYGKSVKACEKMLDYALPFGGNCSNNPNGELTSYEIVQKWKYHVEKHYIHTEDGYTVEIHMYYKDANNPPKQAVVLGPGIALSDNGFVVPDESSLGYALGEANYYVIALNYRGSKYGLNHTKYSPNDFEFWDFSFEDMARHEIRSSILFATKLTGKPVIYIGYSMGCTYGLIYTSEYPKESASNIKALICLAPVAYLDGAPSLLVKLTPIWKYIKSFFKKNLHGHLGAGGSNSVNLFSIYLKEFLLGIMFGLDFKQMCARTITATQKNNADNMGYKVIDHFVQIIESKRFQKYDFGKTQNELLYGNYSPPEYPVNDIQVPVAFFVGKNDYIAPKKNARRIYNKISKSHQCGYHLLDYPSFTHDDFITACDITSILYPKLLKKIEDLTNGICYS